MEQSSSFCGRRTGTQRRKNKKILQGPQESFQAREVSRIYARTKSNRTVLEACQEIFVKQASENHACCKISLEKNFQKERLYAQNVPLFKRLAISGYRKGVKKLKKDIFRGSLIAKEVLSYKRMG